MRFPLLLRPLVLLLPALLLATSTPARASNRQSPHAGPALVLDPARPGVGDLALATLRGAPPLRSLKGEWLGHTVEFERGARSATWHALIGSGLTTASGEYPLKLTGELPGGTPFEFARQVRLQEVRFATSRLRVAEKFASPDSQQQLRIQAERALKDSLFHHGADSSLWSGRCVTPVKGRTSERFGTARVFNGEKLSVHEGLDFRALRGTPVRAVNSGKVLLARALFYEGNCLVLDHGAGLFTAYMHLSKFQVREGDPVRKGQRLGLSRATGRVTGPHLHLSARWDGVPVNPSTLLSLHLPVR